jgi:hypothetical protein
MTRLEALVCALAPACLADLFTLEPGKYTPDQVAELTLYRVRGIVATASMLENAIADRELDILRELNRGPHRTDEAT